MLLFVNLSGREDSNLRPLAPHAVRPRSWFLSFSQIERTKKETAEGDLFVGARGFEPPTSCTPCKRANRAAPRPVG